MEMQEDFKLISRRVDGGPLANIGVLGDPLLPSPWPSATRTFRAGWVRLGGCHRVTRTSCQLRAETRGRAVGMRLVVR
jgi:hypothetical protein